MGLHLYGKNQLFILILPEKVFLFSFNDQNVNIIKINITQSLILTN